MVDVSTGLIALASGLAIGLSAIAAAIAEKEIGVAAVGKRRAVRKGPGAYSHPGDYCNLWACGCHINTEPCKRRLSNQDGTGSSKGRGNQAG